MCDIRCGQCDLIRHGLVHGARPPERVSNVIEITQPHSTPDGG